MGSCTISPRWDVCSKAPTTSTLASYGKTHQSAIARNIPRVLQKSYGVYHFCAAVFTNTYRPFIYSDCFQSIVVHIESDRCRLLLTFDSGVVAAPVKENPSRRGSTAVDLVSLSYDDRQEHWFVIACWRRNFKPGCSAQRKLRHGGRFYQLFHGNNKANVYLQTGLLLIYTISQPPRFLLR